MALVTRCSNASCLTLFRVTPAQLQAFGGQVRCGSCGTVFDAFPSLATVSDAALKAPLAPALATTGDAPLLEAADSAQFAADHPAALPPAVTPSASPAFTPTPTLDQLAVHSPQTPGPASMDEPGLPRAGVPRPSEAIHPDAPGATQAHDLEPAPRPTIDPARAYATPEVEPAGIGAGTHADPFAGQSADASPPRRVAITPEPSTAPAPSAAPELTDYSVTRSPPLESDPEGLRSSRVSRRILAGIALLGLIGAVAAAWFGRGSLPPPAGAFLEQSARSLASMRPAEFISEHGVPVAAVLALLLFYLLRRFRTTWVVTLSGLLLLLSGQLLHAYRMPLAANYPGMRPTLEKFCALARCEVGLPRAAGELVIEASDLQALDVAKPNLIQLSATVRNRAATALAYPAIEVTLTDPQDKPLARRVLLPDQYLARRPDDRIGLRAGEEFSVKLTLDTTELRPVGYRLYLFYP
jgi:predicted Zn finger-like uncharacterized protein